MVLGYADGWHTADAEALADHIYEREHCLHDSATVLRLVAESPDLYEATCPAAERATQILSDLDGHSASALAWQSVYELVVDFAHAQLEQPAAA
jgi:hypothetical protein